YLTQALAQRGDKCRIGFGGQRRGGAECGGGGEDTRLLFRGRLGARRTAISPQMLDVVVQAGVLLEALRAVDAGLVHPLLFCGIGGRVSRRAGLFVVSRAHGIPTWWIAGRLSQNRPLPVRADPGRPPFAAPDTAAL